MVAACSILNGSFNLEVGLHENHQTSHVDFQKDAQNGYRSEIQEVGRVAVLCVFGDEDGVDVFPVVVPLDLIVAFLLLWAPVVFEGS